MQSTRLDRSPSTNTLTRWTRGWYCSWWHYYIQINLLHASIRRWYGLMSINGEQLEGGKVEPRKKWFCGWYRHVRIWVQMMTWGLELLSGHPWNFVKSYFTFPFLRHVLVRATVKGGDEQRVIKTVSVLKIWLKRSFRLCFREFGIIIAEILELCSHSCRSRISRVAFLAEVWLLKRNSILQERT